MPKSSAEFYGFHSAWSKPSIIAFKYLLTQNATSFIKLGVVFPRSQRLQGRAAPKACQVTAPGRHGDFVLQ